MVMNETTMITQKLTYAQWTSVSHSPMFLVSMGIIFILIGIILYLLIAGNVRARTSDGTKLKRSMLSSPNAWLIPLIIWILQGVLIYFLLIDPIWAKIKF